jgi:hypothetical protein
MFKPEPTPPPNILRNGFSGGGPLLVLSYIDSQPVNQTKTNRDVSHPAFQERNGRIDSRAIVCDDYNLVQILYCLWSNDSFVNKQFLGDLLSRESGEEGDGRVQDNALEVGEAAISVVHGDVVFGLRIVARGLARSTSPECAAHGGRGS